MLEDMFDDSSTGSRPIDLDQEKIEKAWTGDRNFSISCELGVHSPTLKAMMNREDLHLCAAVSICHVLVVFLSYSVHIPVIY